MRAPSISSSVLGVSRFLAIPMLLAAFVGGCSSDAAPEEAAGPIGGESSTDDNGGSSSGSANPGEPSAPAPSDPAPAGDPPPSQPPAPPPSVGRIVGYAWLGNGSVDKTTPTASFSYNASGEPITITRTGTGTYDLDFAGQTLDKSVALVTTYGSEAHVCTWVESAASVVSIGCFDETGAHADTRFVATIVDEGQPTGAHILGFAHANDMNADSYTPQASRSNNSVGGGAITGTRTGVGVYKMQFAGLGIGDIKNVQVTPYGSETARCSVASWGAGVVNVRCFNPAGAAADAQYVVMVAGEKPGGTARITGFAHATDSTTASYSPTLSWNETKGDTTAYRSDVGEYSIGFAGLDLNPAGHVQVTGYSHGYRCNVGAWAGTTANVTCSEPDGDLQNGKYGIVVVQ